MDLFKGQFLLTANAGFPLSWPSVGIGHLTLYHHPWLEYHSSRGYKGEVHVLGSIYDWEHTGKTNGEICHELSMAISFPRLLEIHSRYSGNFVIIFKDELDIYLFNDTCSQKEIYYDTDYTTFGSQPKLLEKVVTITTYQHQKAREFYQSKLFSEKRVFPGETTHIPNIKHLRPNHYLDVTRKRKVRFFPLAPLIRYNLEEAALKAAEMIRGYIHAARERKKLAMAVTAGYDSRILFLASLDIDCFYYVLKNRKMGVRHYDIVIPDKMTKTFGKNFSVIPTNMSNDKFGHTGYESSIDFPRYPNCTEPNMNDYIHINGNIGEIARNYYGYHKKLNAEELVYLYGYNDSEFVIHEFKSWLDSSLGVFRKTGYHYLDMFYWEEKMGNWASKRKTELAAIGIEEFSPFNSRDLLNVLLGTPRKYRDSHYNKLYDEIIRLLAPEALHFPLNPTLKKDIIRLMKKFKLYKIYRYWGIKFRWLNIENGS